MQKQVTSDLVDKLSLTHQMVRVAVTSKSKDMEVPWTTNDVQLAASYLGLAQSRDVEAKIGFQRALAALHEAVGEDPHLCFMVVDDRLLYRPLEIDCHEIITLAVARRGEVAQADLAAKVSHLEINAQGKICLPTAKTFAAGADIHSA